MILSLNSMLVSAGTVGLHARRTSLGAFAQDGLARLTGFGRRTSTVYVPIAKVLVTTDDWRRNARASTVPGGVHTKLKQTLRGSFLEGCSRLSICIPVLESLNVVFIKSSFNELRFTRGVT